MHRFNFKLKKIFTLTAIAGLFLFTTHTAVAQNSEGLLRVIAITTNKILLKINEFPTYIKDITEMAKSFLAQDDSDITAKNQKDC